MNIEAPKAKRKSTLDKAIKEIEQGNAWDEGDEVVHIEVKKPLDRVIFVQRLKGSEQKLKGSSAS